MSEGPARLTADWGPNTDYEPDEQAWEDAEDEEFYGPSPEPAVGEPVLMGVGVVLAAEAEEPEPE